MILTATNPLGVQFSGQTWCPIPFLEGQIIGLNRSCDQVTLSLARARWPLQPGVKSGTRHRQHPTHHGHAVIVPIGFDTGVLYLSGFAKYAVAFFKKSRSSSSSAILFFSFRTSTDSSLE